MSSGMITGIIIAFIGFLLGIIGIFIEPIYRFFKRIDPSTSNETKTRLNDLSYKAISTGTLLLLLSALLVMLTD